MKNREQRIEEPIESRWATRRTRNLEYLMRQSSKLRYQETAKLLADEQVGSHEEDDWEKLFQMYQSLRENPSIIPFLREASIDALARKLEIIFLADASRFHLLRSRFSVEQYEQEWNTFFVIMKKRMSDLLIDLARGGLLFEGLDLRRMQLYDLPEFASCKEADMREATIGGHLKNIEWQGADLRGATFSSALFVSWQYFQGANLEGTTFVNCKGLYFNPEGLPDWARAQIEG